MLSVKNISKKFGKITAVNDVSFDLQKGEFFSLLGPNGAGKTTTINMISAVLSPDAGNIYLNGDDIRISPAKSKLHMGIVPQEIALYDDLSAWENLIFWGKLYRMKEKDLRSRAAYLLELVGLTERKKDKIRTYSGGMKRRINIAAAIMHDPELVIMDEPTVGIDPHSRTNIYALLDKLHALGKTILFTTHYMQEAENMSSRIGIIDHGKLIATGTMEELKVLSGIREAIQFQLDNVSPNFTLPEHLQGHLQAEEKKLTIFCSNIRTETPAIMKAISDTGSVIMRMEVLTINLENIFMQLTGTQLRD